MSTQTYASKRHAAQTYTAGNAGTARIDLQNGSIYHTFSDIRCPNGKMPLGISHIYTGDDNFRFATFGKGWHLSICPTFFVAPQIEETVGTYTDSEGYVHPFLGAIGDPVILRDCDGLGLVYQEGYFPIEEGSEETVFLRCLIDQKGNRIEFDNRGRMICGVDTSGNQITVAYDATYDRPIAVTDAAGRVATLAYGEDGRLASITDPKGLAVRYTYDEDGHLMSVTYTESVRRFDFAYDSQNRLISAADDKGKMLRFAYDANARVSKAETVMFRVAYGAIGASTSTIDEVKARDTFAYYGDAAVITALSGMRRIVRMDDLGYPTLTYTEQGTSGVEVDENAFVYKEYGHHDARPYVAYETSGMPCNYDVSVTANASLDIFEGGGRLDNCPVGNTWFGSFYEYGITEGLDGIVSASPMGDSKCYLLTATPNGEKTLEFQKNVEYESFPHKSFAFAVRACVEGVDVLPVEEQEVMEIELKLACYGIAPVTKTVSLARQTGIGHTVVACAKIPEGAHLGHIYATVRCANTRHHVYLQDLRLIPVPYRSTSYVDAIAGETVSAKTVDENGMVTEGEIPFLYKTVTDDGKYVTTSWYAEGEDPILRETKDLSGNVFTAYATYDDKHRLIRSEDIRGRVTEYTYSDMGQVTREKRYHKDNPSACYITEKTYTDEGYLATVTSPRSGNHITSYTYTASGDVANETDPRGSTTQYTYSDEYGYLTWVRGEEVNGEEPWCSYSYSWDEHIGNSTESAFFGFTFDGLGRRKGDLIHSAFWANYSYDDTPTAPKASVTYANGQKITVTKNAAGKPVSRTFTPAGSEEPTVMLTSTYDSAGRLQQKVDNLAETVYNYKYNAKGELIGVTGSTVSESNTYDSYGRIVYHNDAMAQLSTSYQYETRTYGAVYPDASIERMEFTQGEKSWSQEVEKDALGRMTSLAVCMDPRSRRLLTSEYAYYDSDRICGEVDQLLVKYGEYVLHDYEYTYDANGNIESEEDRYSSDRRSYTYDELNRLIFAAHEKTGTNYHYSYDTCGNILTKLVETDGETVSLAEYTYNTDPDGYGDQLLYYNEQECVYDACGNPVIYRDTPVTWTLGRRMASYGENTFAYNGEGVRIRKNDTAYRVNGTRILSETTGNNTLTYLYGMNGILGFLHNTTPYFYIKNLQGDVVAIMAQNGSIVARYDYDPFGALLSVKDAGGVDITDTTHIAHINPIRYRSYYYDTETGLYYLQTRYYDPEVGRFINADAFKYLGADGPIHGMNLYAYCGNNPVSGCDPTGTFIISGLAAILISCAIVIIGNLVVSSVQDAIAENNTKDSYTKDEAVAEIEKITGKGTVDFGENGVSIQNSIETTSRYDRLYVSKIIEKTLREDGTSYTERSAYNLAAEWFGHNLAYEFNDLVMDNESIASRTETVDLNYNFYSNEWYTIAGTIALMLGGYA